MRRFIIMRTFTRAIAGTIAAGALAFGLAGCGGSSGGDGGSGGGGNSSSASAKPVAEIDSLTGKSTSVKLDSGFTGALTSLGLTPGVVGTAQLTDGSLVFPITGGNVTQAAALAKRNRTEFYKLLQRHRLEPAMFKESKGG